MAKKTQIRHPSVVERFAARLRELRRSRGMTQAELAKAAELAAPYVGRLEAGKAAPGIDMVERLAVGLGATVAELVPDRAPPETLELLKERARVLSETMIETADRETLLMVCPLLARIAESATRRR